MKPAGSIVFGIVGGINGGWLGYAQRPCCFGWRATFEQVITLGDTFRSRDKWSQQLCEQSFNQMLTYAAIGAVLAAALGLLIVIATKPASEKT